MSEILESLRNQGEYVEEHLYPLSCKLKRSQQAAVEAVIKLAGNKTNAVRLLIDLGWEALEKMAFLMMLFRQNQTSKKHYFLVRRIRNVYVER